ncbi:uncharacterized protein LOC127833801 isoform X2 [Dreissena polymorpha]|uniref:uncharacterized protein LOC127833801 isoform X2 n=1 Tax=Dreissena polymorpha TaxID=45954 RepID=UPI002264CA0D|nr:uncharacterized protein LOC127833801 isoform X2 [Dreissena polymorpha]
MATRVAATGSDYSRPLYPRGRCYILGFHFEKIQSEAFQGPDASFAGELFISASTVKYPKAIARYARLYSFDRDNDVTEFTGRNH